MATGLETLNNTIKEYDKTDVVHNALMGYDWILNNVKKRYDWLDTDTNYTIKFIGSEASTIQVGAGLADEADIVGSRVAVGHVAGAVPFSGSLKFFSRDIAKHEGTSRQATYITSLVKRETRSIIRRMRQAMSMSLVNGYFSRAIGAGSAGGDLPVSNIEAFTKYQHLIFRNGGGTAVHGYVGSINMDANTITVYSDIALTTALSLSGMANGDLIYIWGAVDIGTGALQNQWISMKSAFLSAANGGSATLHSLNKLDYPFLQAVNVDGGSFSAGTILGDIFSAYTGDVKRKALSVVGSTNEIPNNLLVSSKNFAIMAKQFYENNMVIQDASKKVKTANAYPYQVVTIGGAGAAQLNIIHIPEMDDDFMTFLNPKSIAIASNGKMKSKNMEKGSPLFVVRDTTQEYYALYDVGYDSQVAYENPQSNGIIYGLNL